MARLRPDDGLEPLTERECLSLLAGAYLGRVGITLGGLPTIVPVRYGWLDGLVVFGAGGVPRLRDAVRGAVVAFQVDALSSPREPGWNVHVVGPAEEVRDAARLRAAEALDLRPWTSGGTVGPYLQVRPDMISGYRVPAAGS